MLPLDMRKLREKREKCDGGTGGAFWTGDKALRGGGDDHGRTLSCNSGIDQSSEEGANDASHDYD